MNKSIGKSIAPLVVMLGLLPDCDWAHQIQYQIRPAPPAAAFADTIAAVAKEASLVPGSGTMSRLCPLGAFIESEMNSAQAVWVCAGPSMESLVVDLKEFNRGSPWRPSERFRTTQQILSKELSARFGQSVFEVTDSKHWVTIVETRP